jgi:hypothetical protein
MLNVKFCLLGTIIKWSSLSLSNNFFNFRVFCKNTDFFNILQEFKFWKTFTKKLFERLRLNRLKIFIAITIYIYSYSYSWSTMLYLQHGRPGLFIAIVLYGPGGPCCIYNMHGPLVDHAVFMVDGRSSMSILKQCGTF